MEEFVRKVLSRYTSFVSEKQLYERWLDMRENSDVRDALVMTDIYRRMKRPFKRFFH